MSVTPGKGECQIKNQEILSGRVEVENLLENFHAAFYRVDLSHDHRPFSFDFAQLAAAGILLQVSQNFAEGRRLEIPCVLVRDEMQNHLALFQHHLFHAQLLGHAAQAHHAYQFFALVRYAAEAVAQPFGKRLNVALLLHVVEFLVERDAFRGAGNVVVGEEQFEVRLNLTIGRVALRFAVGRGIQVAKLIVFQLLNRFAQNLLVGLIAQIGDETALFGSKQIACPPYVEVLHGDVYAAAQLRETLDGL